MDTRTAAAWALCIAGVVVFQFLLGRSRRRPPTAAAKSAPTAHVRRRSDLHLRRKAQHLLTGLMIFGASGHFTIPAATTVLFACALGFYGLHDLRSRSRRVDAAYIACFDGLLRQEELQRSVLPGAFYFLVGCGIVLALFPSAIARLAILHLSVGDPAASLIGTLFGRTRSWSSGKSLEGSVGCALAAGAASVAVHASWGLGAWPMGLVRGTIGGLSAAVAESLDLGWDDNLTLPVVSATLQSAAAFLFP